MMFSVVIVIEKKKRSNSSSIAQKRNSMGSGQGVYLSQK